MIRKSRLLFGLLLWIPAMAQALGLGDIHLSSALNQPLSADIEVLGASPEDLLQLRATLASRETFTKHGLDRPQFLTGLTFTVGRDAGGRTVLSVRSAETMTEPFVTFLVEVSWPRGQLVREYTVLLDPPVFEQKPSAAPAVAAPTTGAPSGAAAGTVQREPSPPSPAPAATAPAAPAAAAESTPASEYRVVKNDSLSAIAQRAGATTRSEANRFMISTFRANPAAFDGNINRLHRGAVLKIPSRDEWQALDAREASHEVGRQMSDWRGTATARAPGGEEGRLRLVPPSETGTGSGTTPGKATAPAPAPAPAAGPSESDKKAADQKRLLELKNAELARIQQQQQQAKPAPTPAPTPAPVPNASTATPPPAGETPAVTTPTPKPAVKPAPAAEPSLLDTITDNLLYVALGGVALLLAALIGVKALRRRSASTSSFDRVIEADADADSSMAPATAPVSSGRARGQDTHTIVVEESDDDSGEFIAPPLQAAPVRTQAIARDTAKDTAPGGSIEDTLSSETAINLEQADPLAEADFHMAYGLYDQAADIVKLASEREPARRDLKLKLLEVYFVWGNKDAFLEVARDLGRSRDQGVAGEWDKVVIMGRQIAGDDPLFAGTSGGGAVAASGVDLDLDASGMHRIDLELLGEPPTHGGADSDAVDLDLSQALGGGDSADTGESPTLDPDRIDLLLNDEKPDAGGGTTREMRPRMEAPTVETPALKPAADVPTIETPSISVHQDSTVIEKLDTALKRGDKRVASDATAELSLDDLGFEIDKLAESSTSLSSLSATDHPADAPTMVAGLDDKSRALLASAQNKVAADLEPTRETPRPAPDLEPTRETPRIAADLEPTRETPRPATSEATVLAKHMEGTTKLPRPASDATGTQRVLGTGDLDLDLDELAKALEHDTVEQPRREEIGFSTDVFGTGIRKAPNGIDLDVGVPLNEHREPTVTERISADDLDLPELEPVTLSEVGTKLDLARAYMDMGDPDGARSILQEVLSEGSASQKTEAQRLIETLPG